MDVWDDLIDDLWPEDPDEEGVAISYLHGRLNRDKLGKATALRLSPDLGAESAAALQIDWDWHYRFAYALMAPLIFNAEDPAQWFVDLGLNKYPEKARDVLRNVAIIERRQGVMASLLSNHLVELTDAKKMALEWVTVQANPAWGLARWVMQIAVGLAESDGDRKARDLLRQLSEEHLQLLARYVTALEVVIAAGKQAALEAIDRPV